MIGDREFGEFVGYTKASLENIQAQLQRGNKKFEGVENRLRVVEQHNPNGFRSLIRPGAIGTGAATIVLAIWETIRAVSSGG